MESLPDKIYRAAQVRAIDRSAIEDCEIPGFTLMSRAGQAALDVLRSRWPAARRLLVLCGAGNNAGDGYVLARLAARSGLRVTVAALMDPEALQGDARLAWEMFRQAGGSTVKWEPQLPQRTDVIVDAILGTGLSRALEGQPARVVETLRDAGKPVLALDVPTGLDADTGHPLGTAVRAAVTVTFVGLKLGLYTGAGPEYCGEICFASLGIPERAYRDQVHAGRRIDRRLVRRTLPARARTSHKGQAGRVLLVGGGKGMPGAVRLAAEGALRAGAGLVTVATLPESVPAIVAGRPEVMVHGITDAGALQQLMAAADVVGIGPGLGQDSWARRMFDAVLASDKPLVVDADGLNLLAQSPHARGNWILTPHPGEAARLLEKFEDAAAVQRDRPAALAALIDRYAAVVILKGAGSLVGRAGEVPWICDRGNPGMASAGMGDVLTGVAAGIAAQNGDLFAAARAAAWVHGAAGDDAARNGERGMLASDLFVHLVTHVNQD